jgi:hypothetical protein
MGYRSGTPTELLVRIQVILAEIPRETLNAVFLEWMDSGLGKSNLSRLSRLILLASSECYSRNIALPSVNSLQFNLGVVISQNFTNQTMKHLFGLPAAGKSGLKLKLLEKSWRRVVIV